MGLFDKLKNAVQGGAQPQPQQQQQQWAPPPEEPEESHDEEEADVDPDEVDDWGGMNPHDFQEMWRRVKACEHAGIQHGDDACDAKAREFGHRDWQHMSRIRDTFSRHFGHTHEFTQAALNATMQGTRETLGAAAANHGEIFQPVEGIDLQTYANVQARAASVGNDMSKWHAILGEYGMDQAKWDRVNAEWGRRMSGQGAADMNATYALLAEYGKAFGQAGQGNYGASAAANAGSAGVYQAGQGAVGAEPCTLERYSEIMGAQSAWSQQGRDVNAMLQQQFGMTALDWSNMSQYWSAKMTQDYRIAMQMSDMQQHYEKQYMGAGAGGSTGLDDDLVV